MDAIVLHGNVGFWLRFRALIIDVFMIIGPINYFIIPLIFGWDALKNPDPYHPARFFEFTLVLIVTLTFWVKTGQTPGKKAAEIRIVDVKTGNNPTLAQALLRYVGYGLSLLPLGLGFLLVVWRNDKRSLHDLLAGTCVISSPSSS